METKITPKQLVNALTRDFKVFVRAVIGLENTEFQDDLDDAISNVEYKKIAIAMPRGHGKSTHLSVAFPLWEIAKNHNVRILLISKSAQVSRSFMSEILSHIERNKRYQAWAHTIDPMHIGILPKMKNYRKMAQNWAGDSIVVERQSLNIKDPTINALGLFGSILSKRADIIICDDIVDQENSATELQRQKVIDWIYTTVLPVLVPGGRFIYLGNTWHQQDLVSKLLEDPLFDYRSRKKAIIEESSNPQLWIGWANILLDQSKTVEDRRLLANDYYSTNAVQMEQGVQVLWPERFPYKDLYLLRLSNSYAFSRMYQCDPSNRPDQRFKDEWIEAAIQKGKHLKLQDMAYDTMTEDVVADGVDLAISKESTADDTAIVRVTRVRYGDGIVQPGDYIVRQIHRGKFSPNETKEYIKKQWFTYRINGIRVESVAFQQSMVIDLGESGIPVRGYHTGGEKYDPAIGINSLAIIAELGKLVLPYNPTDTHTVREIARLANEMRAFTPLDHTGDSLMGMWFAYSEIRELTGEQYTIATMGPTIKDSPPEVFAKTPQERKPLEQVADTQAIMEQEYERSNFNRMMVDRFKKAR